MIDSSGKWQWMTDYLKKFWAHWSNKNSVNSQELAYGYEELRNQYSRENHNHFHLFILAIEDPWCKDESWL